MKCTREYLYHIITESMKYFAIGITRNCHCESAGRGNLALRLLRR
jgi:hypothetical protein